MKWVFVSGSDHRLVDFENSLFCVGVVDCSDFLGVGQSHSFEVGVEVYHEVSKLVEDIA